jgi:2-aminoethylphosphonate-pyruvate transaminase
MVLDKIVELAGAEGTHVTVPVQGSGTFAVEAMITSFVPADGKLLVLINGAYGQRARRSPRSPAAPSRRTRRRRTRRPTSRARQHAGRDKAITTSSPSIARPPRASSIRSRTSRAGRRHGRRLLVDSMSAFGALEIDARRCRYDALAASSNKCLEGVPGLGFVVCRKTALAECKGNATTLVLDLLRPGRGFARPASTASRRRSMSSWRSARRSRSMRPRAASPAAAALSRERQGADRRHARHGLPHPAGEQLQAPIIVTFHMPSDPKFVFQRFYDGLKDRGYVDLSWQAHGSRTPSAWAASAAFIPSI